jgi:hypothetical protein
MNHDPTQSVLNRLQVGVVNQRSAVRGHDDKPRDQGAIAGGVASVHLVKANSK